MPSNKKIKIVLIIILFLVIGFYYLKIKNFSVDFNRDIFWGVTFSSKFSKELNSDWQKNFETVLNDLRPKKVRVVAYWDEIGAAENNFNFSDLDWQINELQSRGTETILVVGMKVPRWPECHLPDWAKSLAVEERENKLQEYIGKTVERYKDYDIIKAWQIENEPFLPFGVCPERGKNFVPNEISLVKKNDPERPIIITDGGEFGLWYKAVRYGDIFGTTMYRRVYNNFFGYIDYHLPPHFFILKEKIIRFLLGDYNKKFIVIELATEPWLDKRLGEASINEQFKFFDLEFFKNTIEYAKTIGFGEYYLWGAEWWYYLKVNGYPEIWEEAKKLTNS